MLMPNNKISPDGKTILFKSWMRSSLLVAILRRKMKFIPLS